MTFHVNVHKLEAYSTSAEIYLAHGLGPSSRRHTTKYTLHTILYIAHRFAIHAGDGFHRMILAATRRHSLSFLRPSLSTMLTTPTRPTAANQNGTGSAHSVVNAKSANYTVTALKRWSCDEQELPPVSNVKAIHVYDFDNTRM